MKTLIAVAHALNCARKRNLGDPESQGFLRNTMGTMQKSTSVPVLIRTKQGMKQIGEGKLCYSDQSPHERSTEAELVRSNRWESYQVGKLWLFIKGEARLLAQVDPTGQKAFVSGFFTEDGKLIIDT